MSPLRCPHIQAICRLDSRFPLLRPLWHELWRVAIARALARLD